MAKKGRDRILEAAYTILMEKQSPEKVTIRDIAAQAEVGVGLVNYHFESKEYLLMEAVGKQLAIVASDWQELAEDECLDPKKTLIKMLIQLMELGAKQMYLVLIAAKFELTLGDVNTPNFVVPFIRKIVKGSHEKSADIEDIVKVKAFNLIAGLQSASIRTEQFYNYIGINLDDVKGREDYVKLLVDSL